MEQLGKFLGRYQLVRVLGRGAMGVVYEGVDPKLNRQVAVKTILKSQLADQQLAEEYSTRFIREAQAVARLNHPNIVTVFDFGNEADVAYLVMEFIRGKELKNYLDDKRAFGIAEAVAIVCDLLEALDYAHKNGVIHRDIKPANVMLDGNGRVKLTDFGVARLIDGAGHEGTRAGTMVGTPSYMSPEQIKGLPVGAQADLFATGVLLYQCLTLQKPFIGNSEWDIWQKIVNEDPPALATYRAAVPAALERAMLRALAKDPKHRPATARAMIVDLKAAIAGEEFDADATRLVGAPMPLAASEGSMARTRSGSQGGSQDGSQRPLPQEQHTSEVELEFWRSIKDSTDHEEFQLYLERFSTGTYADLARRKMSKLQAAGTPDGTQRAAQVDASAAHRRQEEPAEQQAQQQREAPAVQPAHTLGGDEAARQADALRLIEAEAEREAQSKALEKEQRKADAQKQAEKAAAEAQQQAQELEAEAQSMAAAEAAAEIARRASEVAAQRQAELFEKEQRKAAAEAQKQTEKAAAEAQKQAQRKAVAAAGGAKSKTPLLVGGAAIAVVLIGGAVSMMSGKPPVSGPASAPAIGIPAAVPVVANAAPADVVAGPRPDAAQQAVEAKKPADAQADLARAAQKAKEANVVRVDQQARDHAGEIAAKKISDEARSREMAEQKTRGEAKSKALSEQKARDEAKVQELASAKASAEQKARDEAKARELTSAAASAAAAQKARDEAKAQELASAAASAASKASDEARAKPKAKAEAKAEANPQALFEQAQHAEKEGRVREAVALYKQAYGAGNGRAARMLGDIYARGSGDVGRDYSEQVQWYGKAKAMGVEVPVLNKRNF